MFWSIFPQVVSRSVRSGSLCRVVRKRRRLSPVPARTNSVPPEARLVFPTLRNERGRLPHFLRYYREMGVNHFLMVDNGSYDGSREYLAEQPDVSPGSTTPGYKPARLREDVQNWAPCKVDKGSWCHATLPAGGVVWVGCGAGGWRNCSTRGGG